jgi:hypothetical protein
MDYGAHFLAAPSKLYEIPKFVPAILLNIDPSLGKLARPEPPFGQIFEGIIDFLRVTEFAIRVRLAQSHIGPNQPLKGINPHLQKGFAVPAFHRLIMALDQGFALAGKCTDMFAGIPVRKAFH